MKWLIKVWQRFFPARPVTKVLVEYQVPDRPWLTRMLFNHPMRTIPKKGDKIRLNNQNWLVIKAEPECEYGTPLISIVPTR